MVSANRILLAAVGFAVGNAAHTTPEDGVSPINEGVKPMTEGVNPMKVTSVLSKKELRAAKAAARQRVNAMVATGPADPEPFDESSLNKKQGKLALRHAKDILKKMAATIRRSNTAMARAEKLEVAKRASGIVDMVLIEPKKARNLAEKVAGSDEGLKQVVNKQLHDLVRSFNYVATLNLRRLIVVENITQFALSEGDLDATADEIRQALAVNKGLKKDIGSEGFARLRARVAVLEWDLIDAEAKDSFTEKEFKQFDEQFLSLVNKHADLLGDELIARYLAERVVREDLWTEEWLAVLTKYRSGVIAQQDVEGFDPKEVEQVEIYAEFCRLVDSAETSITAHDFSSKSDNTEPQFKEGVTDKHIHVACVNLLGEEKQTMLAEERPTGFWNLLTGVAGAANGFLTPIVPQVDSAYLTYLKVKAAAVPAEDDADKK